MKTVPLFFLRISLLASIALLQTACPSSTNTIDTDGAALGDSTAAPGDFLVSENSALNRWLDEPFAVEFEFMTLPVIFDYPPIDEIRYELVDLPASDEMFALDAPSITRRDLLFRIAEFYDLSMKVVGNVVVVSADQS